MTRLPPAGRPVAYRRVLPAIILLLAGSSAFGDEPGFAGRLASELRADFRHHYSWRPLAAVGVGFAATAAMANTNLDQWAQDRFREDLQGELGDDLADAFTGVGDIAQPLPAVPLYLGTMLLGGYASSSETPAARWGANSLRALAIGTPQLVLLSSVSGGQRPEEGAPGWEPFADDNGVSGHSFFGSTPLLTAARMAERRWIRNTLYAVSVLPGAARIYDDKHYFSQAFMGWWLALAATRTVERTNRRQEAGWQVSPVVMDDGAGLAISRRFD